MAQVSVTAVPRVARIQGDMYLGRSSVVSAFFVTDLCDAQGNAVYPGQSYDATVTREVDAAEIAKTVSANGKSYTRGEILNAVAAMAMAWKAENEAAAAAADAAAAAAALKLR